jgi:hypothetical protein
MINPKFLYIVPRDVVMAQSHHLLSAHFLDLDNGLVLLSSSFADENRKDLFERNVSAQPLAHDGDTVTETHAQTLAHLGVKQGHTAKQVRTLAKKIHGLM